ncbi:4-hydroxybenzoate octaprenyltransferase [Orbaceae bacterium ac157xtp]
MKQKIHAFIQLMRLDKPIGTLLLLWPTLWALYLSNTPSIKHLIIFTLGVIVMRSAGCVINDFADRKFDGHVERTKNRPLAVGKLTTKEALMAFILLIILAVGLLLLLPPLTWLIACVAFVTTVIYPFLKRYIYMPQFILGIAFSWGIPMVYATTNNALPLSCWLLFIANILWTIAYDTEYAMVDREDDIKIGVKSTALLFGRLDKWMIALLQLLTLLILIFIGVLNDLSIIFYMMLVIASLLFIYQHVLLRSRERMNCFKAFMNNNYVGLAIFLGLIL